MIYQCFLFSAKPQARSGLKAINRVICKQRAYSGEHSARHRPGSPDLSMFRNCYSMQHRPKIRRMQYLMQRDQPPTAMTSMSMSAP
jgi:hypothetical protein